MNKERYLIKDRGDVRVEEVMCELADGRVVPLRSDVLLFLKKIKKLENFIKMVIGFVPSKQQLAVVKSIDKGIKKVTVRSGHSTGKTALLSAVILWFLFTKPDAKVVCTAPSAHQLFDVLWNELRKWYNKLPEAFKADITILSDKVVMKNGNFAVGRTAREDKPEALQGFHGENILYVIDEASGVSDKIFEVAEGALTSEGSYVILTSNPTRTTGYFYNTHTKDKGWHRFVFNSEESEFATQDWISRMLKKYGRDSNIYRVRVLGEFPTEAGDNVIPYSLLSSAFVFDEEKAIISALNESKDEAEVWGVDVARFGDDSSVLVKRAGKFVYHVDVRNGLDTMSVSSWIASEYVKAATKPDAVFIDVIGVGGGVYDRLRALGIPVIAANSNFASHDTKFHNMRAAMYFSLREALESGLKIVYNQQLEEEMMAITYKFNNSTQKIQISSKDDIRKVLGKSPDVADCLALTFFSPVLKGGDEWGAPIQDLDAIGFGIARSDW